MADDVLGSGINRASIATRDGRTCFLDVPTSNIEWNRNLCSISRATITVDPARCTPALGNVHPWAHSLVVFRDDERVWEGPIRRRRDLANGLTIEASDVLGWTERRRVGAGRRVLNAGVRDQLLWALNTAFANDDPNVMAYTQALGAQTKTADLVLAAGEKMFSEVFTDLTGSDGRWTALGRSVLLWDSAANIGSLRDLSPENHLLSDVEVIEDGDMLATRVTARNDNGVVATAVRSGGTAVDPYYGLVDALVGSGGANPTGVLRTATAMAGRSYPTPLTIEIPGDAALRCDAPFPIHRLVPGIIVPVQTTTATSLTVRGSFVLTSVKVSQAAGKDEVVTITLTPPSEVAA